LVLYTYNALLEKYKSPTLEMTPGMDGNEAMRNELKSRKYIYVCVFHNGTHPPLQNPDTVFCWNLLHEYDNP